MLAIFDPSCQHGNSASEARRDGGVVPAPAAPVGRSSDSDLGLDKSSTTVSQIGAFPHRESWEILGRLAAIGDACPFARDRVPFVTHAVDVGHFDSNRSRPMPIPPHAKDYRTPSWRGTKNAGLAHWFFFLLVLFCFTLSAGARATGSL